MPTYRWLTIPMLTAALIPTLSGETRCPGNVASVPLRHVNRYQMIVQVSVNHSGPQDFLLDTGAQMTILDTSFATDLGLGTAGAAIVEGVGFHEAASTTNLDELAVGVHAVRSQRVVISDLTRLKETGLPISGILGEDFLEHFDMLIDNRHAQLCLDDTGEISLEMKGERIPYQTSTDTSAGSRPAKLLIMSARFYNGRRPVRLMLDSGSNSPFLYGPAEYLALGLIEGASWHGSGANGQQQAFVALPPQDLKISGIEMSKVPFLTLRSEQKGSRSHPASYDGLLPTGFFSSVFLSHDGEFAVLEPKY
jgi:hypothetical protein